MDELGLILMVKIAILEYLGLGIECKFGSRGKIKVSISLLQHDAPQRVMYSFAGLTKKATQVLPSVGKFI